MTDKELEIIETLKDAHDKFNACPPEHSADIPDFAFHIRALQNIVLSREGLRIMLNEKSIPLETTIENVVYQIPKREFININTSGIPDDWYEQKQKQQSTNLIQKLYAHIRSKIRKEHL